MSLNLIAISGNLGSDASLRQTQSGASVLSWSMAVNDRRKNSQTGEWEDVVSWVPCILFGNRAQSIVSYMLKGVKVSIQGKIREDRWQDRESGQNRSRLEVIVDEIDFMSQRQDGGYQQQQPQQRQPQSQQPQNGYGYGQPQPAPQQSMQAPQQAPALQRFDASDIYADDSIPF